MSEMFKKIKYFFLALKEKDLQEKLKKLLKKVLQIKPLKT